jgi:choloylglycine hydrolase
VEALWFPESQYQKTQDGNFVAIIDLVRWLLGNFASIDEVKQAMSRIKVVGVYVPELRQVPGMHVAVHDAGGQNIVIEFIGGEQKIYENPIGVMTNRPTFDWHLTNLRNYISLDREDHPPQSIAGVKIESNGSGNGWIGLPGDWTPPSRFVRVAKFVHATPTVENAAKAVNLAVHILNTVDIPWGTIKPEQLASITAYDYTQWVIVKDLKNKVLYFRSYEDLILKKIDLKKLRLKPGTAPKSIPIENKYDTILNVTDKLL